MPLFQDEGYFHRDGDALFNQHFTPGAETKRSGIYRCIHCGHEVVSEEGKPLPPQNNHQHPAIFGTIIWKLVAATISPKK